MFFICVGFLATPQEKLRHLFRLFDASCDGRIDSGELGRLLSRLHVPMPESEVAALLYKMDRCGYLHPCRIVLTSPRFL